MSPPSSVKTNSSGIVTCPDLKFTRHAGILFTDCVDRDHDMEKQRWLTPKEVAADERMKITGKTGDHQVEHVLGLIRSGHFFPIRRINDRVILCAECAIVDWIARLWLPPEQARRVIERRKVLSKKVA